MTVIVCCSFFEESSQQPGTVRYSVALCTKWESQLTMMTEPRPNLSDLAQISTCYPDVLGTSTLTLCYSSVKCELHGTDIKVYELLFNIMIVLSKLSRFSTIHSTETKYTIQFDKTKIHSSSNNYFERKFLNQKKQGNKKP